MSHRVLDPLERSSEILFGLIMVLTFTLSISVAESGESDTREALIGALGCNFAWGVVDAVMYVTATFMTRARNLATYRAVRETGEMDRAHHLIRTALPPVVSSALSDKEIESLRLRLMAQSEPARNIQLNRADISGALGVFLLVFLSTFPVAIPFLVISRPATALRASNAVAIVMLFVTGWSVGKYAGRSAWGTGLATVGIGIALVAITMALGG